MNISVTSEKNQDNTVVAHVTIDAKDVDKAIKRAYSDIAHKYAFPGFRKGKAPRPVIDNLVGKEGVLAQATSNLVTDVEPLMLEELNVVPLGDIDYGEDPELVVEHKDFLYDAKVTTRPNFELESYDAPSINMPPQEVTEAEIDEHLDQLAHLQSKLEDVEDDRPVEDGDIVKVDVENIENAEDLAGEQVINLTQQTLQPALKEAVVGAKVGDSKEVELPKGEDAVAKFKLTVKSLQKRVAPVIDDEFSKFFGFESLEDLKNAVKAEIIRDKASVLPNLKEERVLAELEKRMKDVEIPAEYVEQVFQEIGQDFLSSLQRTGSSLDAFLQQRAISMDQFIADLREQAHEHARQSLALDSLARYLNLEADAEDIKKQFEELHMPNVEKTIKDFKARGQLPAIRESIKRSKALQWLLEHAHVTEVDEVAERRNQKSE